MNRRDLERLMQQARPAPRRRGAASSFTDFRASELYCPNCKTAVPVREKLLLVLPGGDRYHYTCTRCGASIGDKTG